MGNISPIWIEKYVFVFIASLILSLLLTWISIPVLKMLNIMDKPDSRKIHTHPVPRMGGFAIYIAFVAPMINIMYFDNTEKGIILGSGIALIIGAIDDIWGVPAVIKLLALMLLTVLVWKYGVITHMPLGTGRLREVINLGITMLWLAGVCSAINAVDHMDGLAVGLASIAAFAYLAVSVQTNQIFWGLMSVSLIGSLLGFLWFNRNPAKIFMGDSGSFFLGFSLASIGIMGGWSENPIKAAIIPFAILSIPIIDLIYVVAMRKFTGTTKSLRESITYCGKDHIGHRFCDLGFSQARSVRIICLLSITVAISALAVKSAGNFESLLLLVQILLIYVVIFILLKHPLKNLNNK